MTFQYWNDGLTLYTAVIVAAKSRSQPWPHNWLWLCRESLLCFSFFLSWHFLFKKKFTWNWTKWKIAWSSRQKQNQECQTKQYGNVIFNGTLMLCLCMFHSYLTCFIPDGTININNETIGGFKGAFQNMLSFLKLVFGSDIKRQNTVMQIICLITSMMGIRHSCWFGGQNQCIILTPKDPSRRLPALKKQLKKFQELCTIPCTLGLENLTALQRRNLIENHIPFISMSQQVYLPFWGRSFHEQFKAETLKL